MNISYKNGYKIIENANSALHSIFLSFVICRGSKYEPLHLQGITHLLEHMCFRRCGELNQEQLYKEIEQNGISLNAITTPEYISFELKCTSLKFERALSLLIDMIFFSNWTEDDLLKEKKVIATEFEHSLYNYTFPKLKNEYFFDYYPETILGTEDSLKKISLQCLAEFKDELLNKSEKYIFIAGDFADKELILIEKKFPIFKRSYEKKSSITINKTKVFNISFKKSQDIGIQFICVFNRKKIEHQYIELLKSILFDGLYSSFNLTARENIGLLYDFESQIDYNNHQGMLLVNIELNDINKVHMTTAELIKILSMSNIDLLEERLSAAIPFYTDNLKYLLDDPEGLIQNYIRDLVEFNKIMTLEEKTKVYSEVKSKDLQDIAKKVFVKENCYFVISGKFTKKEKIRINKIIEQF